MQTETAHNKALFRAGRRTVSQAHHESQIAKTFMVPDFETAEHTVALANKLISFSQVNDTQHPEYGIYPGGKLIGSINDCGIEENELEIGYVLQANCVPSVVSKGKP